MVLTGLTILIIGASHLTMPTSLISSLHDNLIKQGAKSVHSVGVCGSRPSSWIEPKNGTCGKAERIGTGPPKLSIMRAGKTTSIKELVEKDKPDMVIIIMGDTLGNYDKKDFDRKWANH